jgi:UDP-glucose 4-epimerase
MHVLVTGGAGYIGSHAVRALLRAGHEVTIYDNLSLGHRQAVPPERLVIGSLHERERLTELMRGKRVDAVMHFAAFTLVGESVTDPQKYYLNNVAGSVSLFSAMLEANVRRCVFSSTAAVYGEPERVPITEDAPLLPVNPYGFTKLAIERALADFSHAYGWGTAALRYFNAAGAIPSGEIGEDHRAESHLIPLVLQVALGQREAIQVFGDDYLTPDGTCVRDYIHVEDLAAAHVLALEKLTDGVAIQANLGVGRGYSVREVIEMCRTVTGRTIAERIAERRAGDPPALVADASRAAELLGWRPQSSDLATIVESAWRWHRAHPRGYCD